VLHDDAALDLTPGGRPLISRAELVGIVFAAAAAVLEREYSYQAGFELK